MPFVEVPFVAEIELVYATPGGTAENTLYLKNTEGWDVESLTEAAGTVVTWWAENVAALISNQVSLVLVRATDLSSATSAQVNYSAPLPAAGAAVSPVLPSNVTLAVTFHTGLRGRSYRGRNYWIGLCEPQVSGDTVLSGNVEAIVDAYEQFRTDMIAAGYTWVVVSRYSGKDILTGKPLPRATGVATIVTTVTANPTVDSQRRRLAGRGS